MVAGQHLMQASSDIFLGWDRVDWPRWLKRDFYIRQLRDWKGSVETDVMVPQAMAIYGQALRVDAGAGSRTFGRPDRHRRVPRVGRGLRPRHAVLRGGVCGPERT